ncbi:MAG: hypothetical protein LIO68_04615, partial [Rikenellaceae bacterium]|nr:hypothetical protein [Rikenellaceae bacterium]
PTLLRSDSAAAPGHRRHAEAPHDGGAVESYGICWSELEAPVVAGNARRFVPLAGQSGTLRLLQSLDVARDGLVPGRIYWVRGFIEKGGKVSYGASQKFSVTEPAVQTGIEVFEIPLVFHVLYTAENDRIQNPTTLVFFQSVALLNKMFGNNFTAAGSSVSVHFSLAAGGPDGEWLPEAGIHRVRNLLGMQSVDPSEFLDMPLDNRLNSVFWDPNRYANVWLLTSSRKNLSGMSVFPYVPVAHPLEWLEADDYYLVNPPDALHGIVLNNASFRDDDNKMTLVHEFGHLFGLFHVFNYWEDCRDTDGCDDTPTYDRNVYESDPLRWMYERMRCDGTVFMSDNIMDYWFTYETTFTRQQCARMEHVLRYGLLTPRSPERSKAILDNFTGEVPDRAPIRRIHVDSSLFLK